MHDMVFRLLRELPDTDKDRYDVAYERGRAQARSSLLFGGMALGLVAGGLGLFLLDPVAGAGRRTRLAQRAKAVLNDVQRTIKGRSRVLQSNVERRDASPTAPGASRYEVRTPPRSAAASAVRREEPGDRVAVAAGTEGR